MVSKSIFPFQMITLGGDAELELVDSYSPFSEGIVFSVRPPKKSWKNIANLSGGEKVFSILVDCSDIHFWQLRTECFEWHPFQSVYLYADA